MQAIWDVLAQVPDPEIPAVSVVDLGIVRAVSVDAVTLTPTYSGCPATHAIEQSVREALDAAGFRMVRIETVLSPPWTTEWITPQGRERLRAYGIAPPQAACSAPPRSGQETAQERVLRFMPRAASGQAGVACPRCGSTNTFESSRFGSTACKALYKCSSCQEPFDYFKPY